MQGEGRDKRKRSFQLGFAEPKLILFKDCKVRAETNENAVFSLALPNRSLSYLKIMQGESRGKRKRSFQLDFAEPKLILFKDCKVRAETNENEVFSFGFAEPKLILSKDNAIYYLCIIFERTRQ